MRSGAGGVLGLAVREQVVNALSDAGLADDASALMLMLEMIRDDLGYSLTVVQHPVGRDTLFELVNACAKTDGGMQVLAHVVGAMRPGSPECVRVLVEHGHVVPFPLEADGELAADPAAADHYDAHP